MTNPYAPKENSSNPYVSGNNEAPVRQREGRIKKPKIKETGSKQPINYFEQAEEAEGLNEFVGEAEKKEVKQETKKEEKELDLNDLLGLNKGKEKKGGDDLEELLGGNEKKKAKKKNDFFDELDI